MVPINKDAFEPSYGLKIHGLKLQLLLYQPNINLGMDTV